MPVTVVRCPAQLRAERQPGLGAARSAGEIQARRRNTHRGELLDELRRSADVPEHADAARSADRDHIRTPPCRLFLGDDLGHDGFILSDRQHRIHRRDQPHARAVEPIEQEVARERRLVDGGREHQHASQARHARGRGRHARVVGLHGAGRNQRGRALRECVGDEVLELACLVAAKAERGQVVALDEHTRAPRRAAERLAQPRRPRESASAARPVECAAASPARRGRV